MTEKRTRTRIFWAFAAIYLIWGSTYLAIRVAIETMPPFLMAGGRFLIAGTALYVFARLRGAARPQLRQWLPTAVLGATLLLCGNGGVVWAEQRVPSGPAALMIGATPLWFILLDWIRPGGQRPAGRAVAGVLIGFVGIAVLINPTSGAEMIDPVGAVVLVLAALSWAIGSLYGRSAALPASPLVGTGMEMLAGRGGVTPPLLGTLTGEWGRLSLEGISAASLWGLAYLIVFGAWVGFGAYTWLIRVAPISLVSTYAYVNPVVAVVLGFMIAGEPLTWRTASAAAIIVGSVALTTTARRGA